MQFAISLIFQINHLRNLNRISVTGTHVPKLILEFDELKTNYQVSENLLNNMKTCGYIYPTPIQKQAIPVMLEVSYNCYLYGKKVIKQSYKYFFYSLLSNRIDKYLLALQRDQEKPQHFCYL